MRILYFDCFNGASGDMILGACLDAGLPLEDLRRALGSLGIADYELRADRVLRAGVSATKFRLEERAPGTAVPAPAHPHLAHSHPAHDPAHPHDHAHPHDQLSSHHSLPEIEALIGRSALSPAARDRAVTLFRRLAEAEAGIHQMPVKKVHLHEVGALDSIIDIVGAVFALEWFGADRVVVSPLNVGSGMVRSAHGVFPVPAPATVALLGGAPVFSRGPEAELLTPTGALLLTGHASSFGPVPAMRITATGYGAGERDFPDTPNVLRLMVGEADAEAAMERVAVLACEIDDMNPQIFGVLMDRLYAEGALEVFFQPVQMKKNRPGTLVTVIAPPDRRHALSAIVFRETTTIGIRFQEMHRQRLEREWVAVDTPFGPVRIKVARRAGEILNAAPEFDDCARLAAERQVPVKDVQAAAVAAWVARPAVSGQGPRV
jgi:hypothetical protein